MTSQNLTPGVSQNSNKQTALCKSNVWLAGTLEAYLAIVSQNHGQIGSDFERKRYLCNVESSIETKGAMVKGTTISVPTYLTRYIPCPDQCHCKIYYTKPDQIACSGKSLTLILHAIPANISLLTLYMDRLKSLPHGIFNNNTKLRLLYLQNNKLEKLHNDIFSNNTKLTNLYLQNITLKELYNDIFSNNTKLTHLELSYNQLKTLPKGVFSKNTKLQYMYLHRNQLENLPKGVFSANIKLELL
ncbi:hypothetical protein ACROYT_G031220 [Oculina patagonica]